MTWISSFRASSASNGNLESDESVDLIVDVERGRAFLLLVMIREVSRWELTRKLWCGHEMNFLLPKTNSGGHHWAVFGMVLWESGGDKCTPLAGHRGIFSKLESSRWVEMDHFLHGIWAGDRSYRVLCIREDESRTGFRPSNLGKSRKGLSRCFILGCGAVCWGTCASQSNGRFSGRSVSEDGGGALAGVSLLGPWNRVDRLATGPGDDQSTTGEATRMERRWITCGTWRWWYMIDESNPKDMGDARWYSLRRWWLIPCS